MNRKNKFKRNSSDPTSVLHVHRNIMSLEIRLLGETFVAVGAFVWPLSCVNEHVSLEVAGVAGPVCAVSATVHGPANAARAIVC